jgi:hypothetical protein
MSKRRGKKPFPNPFYVLLLAASTLFVLTILGYLVAPAPGQAGAGAWLERNAPAALGAELAVMLASFS